MLETESKWIYCYGITRVEAYNTLKPVYQFENVPEDLVRVHSFKLGELKEEDLAIVDSENLFIKFLKSKYVHWWVSKCRKSKRTHKNSLS